MLGSSPIVLINPLARYYISIYLLKSLKGLHAYSTLMPAFSTLTHRHIPKTYDQKKRNPSPRTPFSYDRSHTNLVPIALRAVLNRFARWVGERGGGGGKVPFPPPPPRPHPPSPHDDGIQRPWRTWELPRHHMLSTLYPVFAMYTYNYKRAT